jgi:hypothetical protein
MENKEKWFIEDVQKLIVRGQKEIPLSQFGITQELAANILKKHLGIDVWLRPMWLGMLSHEWYICTDFSDWYVIDYDGEIQAYTPTPFNSPRVCSDMYVQGYKTASTVALLRKSTNKPKPVKIPWYKKLFKL